MFSRVHKTLSARRPQSDLWGNSYSALVVQLPKQDIPNPDISVQQWMVSKGVDARAIELADVCYANDFGSCLEELGMTEAILEARAWHSGESYLIKDRSFTHLVRYLAQGLQVWLSWPVKRIEWEPSHRALITGPRDEVRGANLGATVVRGCVQPSNLPA
jgi:hypothetical protein